MKVMEKCLIVAVGLHNEIGVRGGLPWHLKRDLQYFKETTSGYPVIMGRTTYFSLPKHPLPGRKNIVLNAGGDPIPEACCVMSFEEAYAEAAATGAAKCFIMGGASVYRAALNDMDTLYVTQVETAVPEADVFFPKIDPQLFYTESVSALQHDDASGLDFRFTVYRKR